MPSRASISRRCASSRSRPSMASIVQPRPFSRWTDCRSCAPPALQYEPRRIDHRLLAHPHRAKTGGAVGVQMPRAGTVDGDVEMIASAHGPQFPDRLQMKAVGADRVSGDDNRLADPAVGDQAAGDEREALIRTHGKRRQRILAVSIDELLHGAQMRGRCIGRSGRRPPRCAASPPRRRWLPAPRQPAPPTPEAAASIVARPACADTGDATSRATVVPIHTRRTRHQP